MNDHVDDLAAGMVSDAPVGHVELAAGTGAALVGFMRQAGGAGLRTLAEKMRELVSVRDFGAVGDGVTDDTLAFRAAFTASRGVYVPAGNYLLTGPVGSLSDQVGINLCGQGSSCVRLLLSGSAAGLQVSGRGWAIEGIRFEPLGVVAAAITTGIVADNHAARVSQCEFVTDTGGSYFEVAVDLYQFWYSSISDCYFRNAPLGSSTCVGVAVRCNYSVNDRMTNCTIYHFERGVLQTAAQSVNGNHCEGWLIAGNTFVVNNCHFRAEVGLLPVLTGNIFDVTPSVDYPIYSAADCTTLSGNWFYCPALPVMLVGTSRHVVNGNTFVGTQLASSLLNFTDATFSVVSGNTFLSGVQAITANGSCNNFSVSNNIFANQAVRSFDLSMLSGRSVVSGSIEYGASAGILGASTYQPVRQYPVSVVVSLMGGASSQRFEVTIPPGLFNEPPTAAIAQSFSSSDTLISYDFGNAANSASSVMFMVRSRDGSGLTAGQIRVSVVMFE